MKVYCCTVIRDYGLFFSGGVYDIKRNLEDAMDSIRHQIRMDYEAGIITTNPVLELVKKTDAGTLFWVAVAYSKSDEEGRSRTFRYMIDELPLDMRRKR